MRNIKHFVNVLGNEIQLNVPRKCYFCNASLSDNLELLASGYTSDVSGIVAEHGTYFLLIKCPYCECIKTNLYSIRPDRDNRHKLSNHASLKRQNKRSTEISFPEIINKVSPRFVSIYYQAYESEKSELNELSGMGYRKALEFLVKDYAIHKFPDDKQKIIKSSLQKALAKIDTHEIKVLGQVATKIGNDETHYYRKHDWDILELKNNIEAIVFFITSDLTFDLSSQRLLQDRDSK
ncbi:hypothetical protein [Enterococcus gallinarum]|uniref:hypothetical protein n=1 Tax=Enterococcus gallinarum TaxID=1353 RepID=UPI00214BA8D0|nr:hypothetical protein [Enterococcus gallinarum]MCR1943330.1 hypothetical protein [Enterococcus gallinarum]